MEEKHKHRWKLLEILPSNFWNQYPTAVYICIDCQDVKTIYLNNPEEGSLL